MTMTKFSARRFIIEDDDVDFDVDDLLKSTCSFISTSSLNITTRETSALFELVDSLDLLAKSQVFDGMPITRNEYYRIGEAVLTHMKGSNPVLAKSAAGEAMLDLMKKALRGTDQEELQPLTLSPQEGAAWGLPRGIVVNESIKEDFGYPGILHNYHTPEYERMYARRKYLKRSQERIVFRKHPFREDRSKQNIYL